MNTSGFRLVGAAIVCAVVCGAPRALAAKRYRFIDNHPTGGPGATGKTIFFNEGDARYKIEPPGLCGQPFIGGTVNGHADPRLANPNAVCGHGWVFEIGVAEPASRPLSIQPITAPIDPDADSSGAGAAGDARRVIREQLTQLDRPEGDRIAAVIKLRSAVHTADVVKAAKSVPKRQPK